MDRQESHHFQSDYYGETTVHPLALVALVVAMALTLLLPRKWALLPALCLVCFVPSSQRLVLLTLDFTFVRLLAFAGLARCVMRNEYAGFKFNKLDKFMIIWGVAEMVLATLSSNRGPVYFAGEIVTRLGLYFFARMVIRSYADVHRITVAMAFFAIPVAVAFVYEHFTAHNIFSVFGGVPAKTDLRQGRLRCQGAFAHPILAGCFWASMTPLMVALWRDPRKRAFALVGLAMSSVIVLMCASSTPVFAMLIAVVGMLMIRVRRRMRLIAWGTLVLLVCLHMVMNKPVWHLLARVSVVGGSTGWHRYALIDGFVNHWREWIVRGSGRGAAHWGRGLFDVTNYYIIQGLRGGIVLLVLFIIVLASGFKMVGRTWRKVDRDRLKRVTAWAVGVVLFQHCMNFIAVTYFGQINVVWCMHLAMIGSLFGVAVAVKARSQATVEPEPLPQALPAPAPEPGPRPEPEPEVPLQWPPPPRPRNAPVPTAW
jgi:hypothetical protein